MPSDNAHGIVQLVRALSGPMILEEPTLIKLWQLFRRKRAGEAFNGAQIHAEMGIPVAQRGKPGGRAAPTIAVIPVQGIIAQHAQSMGTSVDQIDEEFTAALANPRIDAILFDVDSPGGTINGVPEFAAKILAARGDKPIVALANGLAASAAYWIASAADEMVVTPSGETGSIGVYMLHEDRSRSLEQEGIAITAISAGKYKMEGASFASLSPEAEAAARDRVEEVYGWFVRAVAQGRRDSQQAVRSGYGEGRVMGAAQSVKAKLADRVGTFEETVGRLAARVSRSSARGPSASLLRKRLDLAEPL